MITPDKNTIKIKVDNFFSGSGTFRERRHSAWNEIYRFYRDKVIVNRLTQRQSINVPLMKETIKTLLSKIDDAPDIAFEELDNNEQLEIELNEYWKEFYNKQNVEIKDIQDKKQVGLYGRSFKKLNIRFGQPTVEILDPMDVRVDRFVDPADIETANYLCHEHIYRTLEEVAGNSNYNKDVIQKLKAFFATKAGLIKSQEHEKAMMDRHQKLSDMGVTDVFAPMVGEVVVELREHFMRIRDEKEPRGKIFVITECENMYLMIKPLEEVLNVDFYPIETWGEDIERTDFWSDGVGDIVRTPNKIANSWISQITENRTLRNFGMHYYDKTADENWQPQTMTPRAFGWYPVPGDPNKVMKRIEVPNLAESLNELTYIVQMVERATATTATEKGTSSAGGKKTLGEIEIMSAKAMERITSASKFYKHSWKKFGEKWVALVLANKDILDPIELYKKSYSGKYFSKVVDPSKFKTEKGVRCIVTSSAEKEQKTLEAIQKMQAVKNIMPNNKPLEKVFKKKVLSMLDITPEEESEIMSFEEDMASMAQQPGVNIPTGQPALAPQQL